MKNIALIPARGGSKGIPGKNIKVIKDNPLISWSIQQALRCEEIDRVFVSTDSDDIREVAERFGAEVPFLRPQEISGDNDSTESAIMHFINWCDQQGVEFDNLILLQATSPTRYPNTISEAIHEFEAGEFDSLLTVVKSHSFYWKKNPEPTASYDVYNRPRRQDITKQDTVFCENGSFYITKRKIYENFENRLGGKIGMYEMTPEESFEIDEPVDFKIVEFLMNEYGIEQ